jgi:DNA-binding NtrC family response regulator
MSLAAQAKVLRALQEGIVTRVGGEKPIRSTCASSRRPTRSLEAEIAAGRFREDLFHRLNVVPIHVPPLRERREDVPCSCSTSPTRPSRSSGCPSALSRRTPSSCSRAWTGPGNVRELRNTVERLLILARGEIGARRDVERLVGGGRARRDSLSATCSARDLRRVQGARGARVHPGQAARERLERERDRAHHRHAALEPVQEDREVRLVRED